MYGSCSIRLLVQNWWKTLFFEFSTCLPALPGPPWPSLALLAFPRHSWTLLDSPEPSKVFLNSPELSRVLWTLQSSPELSWTLRSPPEETGLHPMFPEGPMLVLELPVLPMLRRSPEGSGAPMDFADVENKRNPFVLLGH